MPRKQVAVVDDRVCCPSVTAAPLSEAEATDLARVLSALADPVRLRLLSLIAEAGEICACDLLAPLGKSQPTVSHHTKALADVGLIIGEKEGRWIWWSIVPETARRDPCRARPIAAAMSEPRCLLALHCSAGRNPGCRVAPNLVLCRARFGPAP
jgi:ArsR family transcriptional regulator